jgi:hypothetical protein
MNHSKDKPKGARLILGEGVFASDIGIVVERVIWHGPRPKRLIINGQVIGSVGMRVPLNLPVQERRGV